MCGVFGCIGEINGPRWREAHRLLQALAFASEQRGTDASGYAALTARGALLWGRQPGRARELFEGSDFAALRRRRVVMAIGHTRHATCGLPTRNENNHPHLAGDWALVHNGCLPGHRQTAARLNLPLQSECDSELLAQALHRYGEAAGPEVCLSLGGKQSVLAVHAKTRRLLAWTNGEMPLVAFRVKGWPVPRSSTGMAVRRADLATLWWASTEEIAREALAAAGLHAKVAAAEPHRVYRMEWRDGRVVVQSTPASGRH
jgi:glucosamine 6-phosphate synthetase-like amidotransferase/phosphosugar isomerase protein